MKTERQRCRIGRMKSPAQLPRPESARRAILGDLLEKIIVGVKKERQSRGKVIDAQSLTERRFHIGQTVVERECQLLHCGGARLTDVIAANADRMIQRYGFNTEFNNIVNDLQRWRGRADPFLLGKVFFQDIVLQRTAEPIELNPLPFRGHQVHEALARARSGGGPTFIEAVTFRIGDHTTADDASRYRSKEIVEEWKRKDPIHRLIRYMISQGLWNEDYGQQTLANARERVEAAVKEFEAVAPPKAKDMFRFTFAEMTEELREQMEALLRGNGRVH